MDPNNQVIIDEDSNSIPSFPVPQDLYQLPLPQLISLPAPLKSSTPQRNLQDNQGHISQNLCIQPEMKSIEQKDIAQQIEIQPIIPQLLQNGFRQERKRLVIHTIILEDFKSYAGKQIIGPLHKSFTSIVGPNGSGKSNLLQSLLFVFGFHANWVRLSKLSQLIHRSSGREQSSKASVEVQFERLIERQGEQDEVIENFCIKRVVTADSTSKYFLNNKDISHSKLREKLKQQGIDLTNNRFLILQGEVESISQMKAKGTKEKPGMLEYLEEIIGSQYFLAEIEELAQKYSELEEIKHRRGESVKLLENELKSMIHPKNEALYYTKLQTKILTLKSVILQIKAYGYEKEGIRALHNLEKLEKQQKQTIEIEKQKLQKEKKRITEIKSNKRNIEACEREEEENRKIYEKLNLADKNLNKEIEFKSEDSVKYEKKVQEIEKQLNEIIKSTQEMVDLLPEMKKTVGETKTRYEEKKEEVSKYNKPELAKQIRTLQKNIKNNRLQSAGFQQKIKIFEKQFEQLFTDIRVNDERMKSHQIKIQDNQKMLGNIKAALVKAQFIHKDLTRNIQNHQCKEKAQLQQIQKLSTQICFLKEETQSKSSINSMFSKIMDQKIPGVLGRLGDLGAIKSSLGNTQKYDEILTSCIGDRIDSIVVKNIEAAQQVIQFLKVNQLGRVSCIILDKIQEYANYMRKQYQTPLRCLRLFDLIDVKMEEARVAFYFILNDSLFCQDSNEGLKYAMNDERNRRRVISYNQKKSGFIIYELNGLMNGRQKKSGGFQIKATSQNIQKINKEIEQLNTMKQEEQIKLNDLREKIGTLRKSCQETESDISQLRKEKGSLELSMKNLSDELEDLKKSNYAHLKDDSSKSKKANKEKEIQNLKIKLQKIEETHKQLCENLLSKQEQQKQNQSEEIAQLRRDFASLKEEYQAKLNQINNDTAKIKTNSSKIESLKKKKEDLTHKINALKKEIDKMQHQRENMEKMAIKILAKNAQCERRLLQIKNLDKEMRILLQEENKQVLESKRKIEEMKGKVDEVKKSLKRLETEKSSNLKQFNEIKMSYSSMIEQYSFLAELKEIQSLRVETLEPKVPKNNQKELKKYLQSLYDILDNLNPVKELSEAQLEKYETLQKMMEEAQQNLIKEFSKCSPTDIRVLGQYKDKCKEYCSKMVDLRNTENNQNSVRLLISEKKQQRLQMFMNGFNIINSKLKQIYQHLTKGGDAELEQVDTLDPFSDGISFSVRPYKKSWKQINKLSGGEKTLSSLSLILSLHHYKPNPIYFMDEIDAALDYKNVQIVANYLKQQTKNAQFIVISLRNNMFEVAQKLIGIYKLIDCTHAIEWEGEDDLLETGIQLNEYDRVSQNEEEPLDIQEESSSSIKLPEYPRNHIQVSPMRNQDIFRDNLEEEEGPGQVINSGIDD